MYLTAIMDVYSRKIVSWELSNSLSMDFCLKVFKEAVKRYGAPDILNTDQGSQYPSLKFIDLVTSYGSKFSIKYDLYWEPYKEYWHLAFNGCLAEYIEAL